jgi:HAD superfamily phosphoserine phosphatase-like hydrolase
MISVIIPVLNESDTIGNVVEFARGNPKVKEVIVVDDGSIDGTPELAASAGAIVITSTLLGKGASMEDGMHAASTDILLYLDGDLVGLRENLIETMTGPITSGWADFVKAKFSRSAGRVTTLTARPLLATFFPELASFEQPLGGIVAARRSLLERLQFETDYGVDVGLLIDAAYADARLAEADIGHIEHDRQPLEILGDMATQVTRTILDRAARHGRLHPGHLREICEVQHQTELAISCGLPAAGAARGLALFDMDGTLIDGRYAFNLANRVGKSHDLDGLLDNLDLPAEERARRIAAVFTDVPRSTFEQTAREIPLMPGARETVIALRKAGFQVGIVTDSYSVASEIVRRRVFADFSIGHQMKFHDGMATGKLTLSPAMFHPEGCPHHVYCKRNAMLHLMDRLGIGPEHVLAVGDSENDICLLEAAGRSVALRPATEEVRDAAKCVVWGDLTEVVAMMQD